MSPTDQVTPAASGYAATLSIEGLRIDVPTPRGRAIALDGVDLTVRPGRIACLVGESGSGKSLTALAVMGLLPPAVRVTGGRVRLGEREVTGLSERALRAVRGREVGMVFQEPMTALNPVMRAGDQVIEAIEAHESISRRAARERALGLFREVGIPEPEARLRAYPHELSGGMKQRVGIAIALAARPRFLIADEPTTALDVTVQAQVLERLARLGRERGLGVLLITHDLGVVAEVGDEVSVMYLGRIVERGPATEVLRAPRHPYTRGLLRSVPRLGARRARLDAIPGSVPPLWEVPSGCRYRTRCPRVEVRCASDDPLLAPAPGCAGTSAVACWVPVSGDDA